MSQDNILVNPVLPVGMEISRANQNVSSVVQELISHRLEKDIVINVPCTPTRMNMERSFVFHANRVIVRKRWGQIIATRVDMMAFM